MEYRRLGRTGLEVSVLGLGSGGDSRLGQSHGHDQAAVDALVGRALELGINVIDSAPTYGRSEQLLGAALRGVPRDSYVLSSKHQPIKNGFSRTNNGTVLPADDLRASLERSLADLRTDFVDLFYLHVVRAEHLLPILDEVGPTLSDLKRQGLIRHIAISEAFAEDHDHLMAQLAIRLGLFDVIMVGYNLMTPAPARLVFPLAQQHDVGVVVMCAVRGALLRPERLRQTVMGWQRAGRPGAEAIDPADPLGWVRGPGVAGITDAAYKFAVEPPEVSTVLTGTGRIEHLEANAAAILGEPLPAKVSQRAQRVFGPICRNVDR